MLSYRSGCRTADEAGSLEFGDLRWGEDTRPVVCDPARVRITQIVANSDCNSGTSLWPNGVLIAGLIERLIGDLEPNNQSIGPVRDLYFELGFEAWAQSPRIYVVERFALSIPTNFVERVSWLRVASNKLSNAWDFSCGCAANAGLATRHAAPTIALLLVNIGGAAPVEKRR